MTTRPTQDESCQSILEQLTPKQREVVALLMEGYSQKEAAEILKIKPNAVWRRTCEARKRLERTG